jgi:hypothetical protein
MTAIRRKEHVFLFKPVCLWHSNAVNTDLIPQVMTCSEVIFCPFVHIDAYESTWSNVAQRGETGQFVPWLCVEQAVSYWLYFTFNYRTSRTSMLRVAPTALLHPLAISSSVQTHIMYCKYIPIFQQNLLLPSSM